MAEVYKFKVKLVDFQSIIWRDIEITSVSSVTKLGYAVLAAFESTGSHLFNIRCKGKLYEIVFDDDFPDEPVIDPIKTKLTELNLSVGDVLNMEYDYGTMWKFSIELATVNEMKRGMGKYYPYVTDGKGKGIIEDISPCELMEMVEKTNNDGVLPKVYDYSLSEEIDWDYRDFDLELCNMFFKDNLINIQCGYEKD